MIRRPPPRLCNAAFWLGLGVACAALWAGWASLAIFSVRP